KKRALEIGTLCDKLYEVPPISDDGNVVVFKVFGRKITLMTQRPRPGIVPENKHLQINNCKLDGCGDVVIVDLAHPMKIEFCTTAHRQKHAYLKRTTR